MQTIPAPPPSRPHAAPRALWLLWLALAPGVAVSDIQAAARGQG